MKEKDTIPLNGIWIRMRHFCFHSKRGVRKNEKNKKNQLKLKIITYIEMIDASINNMVKIDK